MVVVRKLRMEALQGDGVLPRTDAKLVEWKSTIYDGVDGLLLKLVGDETATVTVRPKRSQRCWSWSFQAPRVAELLPPVSARISKCRAFG